MKDRIIRLMNAEGISSSRLADDIGVQRSSVSHLLSGRNNPSFEFIHKMLSRFPRLNAEWLIMGTGAMYKDVHQTQLFSTPEQKEPQETVLKQPDSLFDMPQVSDTVSQPPPALPVTEVSASPAESVKQVPLSGKKKAVRLILVYEDKTFDAYPLSDQ